MMATLAFKELMSSYEKGKLILFYMIVSVGICLLKVNNRNTRTRCEICAKLTIKIPERRHWRRFGVFIVNFKHIIAWSVCAFACASLCDCFCQTVLIYYFIVRLVTVCITSNKVWLVLEKKVDYGVNSIAV